jgi:hypothetical protein
MHAKNHQVKAVDVETFALSLLRRRAFYNFTHNLPCTLFVTGANIDLDFRSVDFRSHHNLILPQRILKER